MLEGSPDHSDLHWTPVHHRSGSAFQSSRRPNVTRQDNSLNDSSPWRFGPEGPSNDQKELRTLVAKNLPDRIKHLDIVNVVRGSALLDVWVRHVDRFANISFVDAEAAKNFLTYTKRNPIYIHGSKVSFKATLPILGTNKLFRSISPGAIASMSCRSMWPTRLLEVLLATWSCMMRLPRSRRHVYEMTWTIYTTLSLSMYHLSTAMYT